MFGAGFVKKGVLVYLLLAVLALLALGASSVSAASCCLNPNAIERVCASTDVSLSECCPSPPSDYPRFYTGIEKSQQTCSNLYFRQGQGCSGVDECVVGCCCPDGTVRVKSACSGSSVYYPTEAGKKCDQLCREKAAPSGTVTPPGAGTPPISGTIPTRSGKVGSTGFRISAKGENSPEMQLWLDGRQVQKWSVGDGWFTYTAQADYSLGQEVDVVFPNGDEPVFDKLVVQSFVNKEGNVAWNRVCKIKGFLDWGYDESSCESPWRRVDLAAEEFKNSRGADLASYDKTFSGFDTFIFDSSDGTKKILQSFVHKDGWRAWNRVCNYDENDDHGFSHKPDGCTAWNFVNLKDEDFSDSLGGKLADSEKTFYGFDDYIFDSSDGTKKIVQSFVHHDGWRAWNRVCTLDGSFHAYNQASCEQVWRFVDLSMEEMTYADGSVIPREDHRFAGFDVYSFDGNDGKKHLVQTFVHKDGKRSWRRICDVDPEDAHGFSHKPDGCSRWYLYELDKYDMRDGSGNPLQSASRAFQGFDSFVFDYNTGKKRVLQVSNVYIAPPAGMSLDNLPPNVIYDKGKNSDAMDGRDIVSSAEHSELQGIMPWSGALRIFVQDFACSNGKFDYNMETDTDCGLRCGKCPINKACLSKADCQSNFCNQGKCAVFSSCLNNVQDSGETGLNCGGPCPPCETGSPCKEYRDCSTGYCSVSSGSSSGVCSIPSCTDGVINGRESDIDCGGTCGGCKYNQRCGSPLDCRRGMCANLVCAASCYDGEKNADETGIDCGGSCPNGCANDDECRVSADCQSNYCNPSLLKCERPECSAANPCPSGKICDNSRCVRHCNNNQKDGSESDVDCGGSCVKCVLGQKCNSYSDCRTKYCSGSNICTVEHCSNGVKDGTESDVDCGGSCIKCYTGKNCDSITDCGAGLDCISKKCVKIESPKVELLNVFPDIIEEDESIQVLVKRNAYANVISPYLNDEELWSTLKWGYESVEGESLVVLDNALQKFSPGDYTLAVEGWNCPVGVGGVKCTPGNKEVYKGKVKILPKSVYAYLDAPQEIIEGTLFAILVTTDPRIVDAEIGLDILDSRSKVIANVKMFNDGKHGDFSPQDNIHGGVWNSAKTPPESYYIRATLSGNLAGSKILKTYIRTFRIVSSGVCEDLIPGNDASADRVNFVFVGIGYESKESFLKYAQMAVDPSGSNYGLLSVEPFTSNRNKMNFYAVYGGNHFDEKLFTVDAFRLFGLCPYSNKLMVVLVNGNIYPGFAIGDQAYIRIYDYCMADGKYRPYCKNVPIKNDCEENRRAYYDRGLDDYNDDGILDQVDLEIFKACHRTFQCDRGITCIPAASDNKVVVHEIGHSFGRLADEYAIKGASIQYSIPNCYVGGAKVECREKAPWNGLIGYGCGEEGTVDCEKGTPLYSLEVDCHEGCGLKEIGAFRSVYTSIMSCLECGTYDFGLWNKKLLTDKLNKFSGASCSDGIKNGGESDTDCGGSCSVKCGLNKACRTATDCESGNCGSAGKCSVNPCNDGIKNGDETDTDCGGPCVSCAQGKLCRFSTDCATGYCNPYTTPNKCATVCTNGAFDGFESDVDCGGNCLKCSNGKSCSENNDCISGLCGADKKCH
ncbi:hypothetical protein HYY74_06680 [Candidatus Woesearchaeota archaeon]|nr:hypothetical protein [Candidatus Woesearchaeota archaeon]